MCLVVVVALIRRTIEQNPRSAPHPRFLCPRFQRNRVFQSSKNILTAIKLYPPQIKITLLDSCRKNHTYANRKKSRNCNSFYQNNKTTLHNKMVRLANVCAKLESSRANDTTLNGVRLVFAQGREIQGKFEHKNYGLQLTAEDGRVLRIDQHFVAGIDGTDHIVSFQPLQVLYRLSTRSRRRRPPLRVARRQT